MLSLAQVRAGVRALPQDPSWSPAGRAWVLSPRGARVVRDWVESASKTAAAPIPRCIPSDAAPWVQALRVQLGKTPGQALGDGLAALLKATGPGDDARSTALPNDSIFVPEGTELSGRERTDMEAVLQAIRSGFDAHLHLLKPYWRTMNRDRGVPSTGFCYAATEAAFHLLGGKDAGWTPQVAKELNPTTKERETHWWLVRSDGVRVDPTRDQYGDQTPPYAKGRGAGFLTGYDRPSKAGKAFIKHARAALSPAGGAEFAGKPKALHG